MVIHFFHALIHKKPINENEFFGIIITVITNLYIFKNIFPLKTILFLDWRDRS